jgi:hypothetical protein
VGHKHPANHIVASAAKQSRLFPRMHLWIASLRSQ